MIIQFDVHKAKQGSCLTDHVWNIGLSGTELSALYGLTQAAGLVLSPTSPSKALGENILAGVTRSFFIPWPEGVAKQPQTLELVRN